MIVPEEISLLVSSDPAQGASNVSQDGSSFEIQLDDPIVIPRDALNVTVSVEEASVWWVVPNIISDENDTFYVFGDLQAGGTQLAGTVEQYPSGLERAGVRLDTHASAIPPSR